MPRKAKVKVQSATSTNTKLALATAALLIASGLAFIAVPQVRGPGGQQKCGLNTFEFRAGGKAKGACYSGKEVSATIRRADSQTLRANLTAQCLAECLQCPKGYEAVAGQEKTCLISCVKAEKKKRKKTDRQPTPSAVQEVVGNCTNAAGEPMESPNDGVGVCRGHDGSPNDYIWTGPGPEAESEYCPSDSADALPCTYRCPTGERTNPNDGLCQPYPFETSRCEPPKIENEDSVCVCPEDRYEDQHGYCVDRASCDTPDLVIDEENRTCLPPIEDEPEERPMQISQIAPGLCLGPDGSPTQNPTSDSYFGDVRSCENGGRPEPGQSTEWTYDADCSTNQVCTFQCGDNRILSENNYCEYCSNGFSPNSTKTACVCVGIVEDRGSFERCVPVYESNSSEQINFSMGQRPDSNIYTGPDNRVFELTMFSQSEVEILSLDFNFSTSNLSLDQNIRLVINENQEFTTRLDNRRQQSNVYNATFSADPLVVIGGGQLPTNLQVYADILGAQENSQIFACLLSVRHRSTETGVESSTELDQDYCWRLRG